MPFQQTCWFGKKGSEGRRSEDFTIYKVGEKGVPEYWTKDDWKNIHKIEIGEYVETLDGFICPVIKINTGTNYSCRIYFRIANKTGYAFRFGWVSQGKQEIYYDPPQEYFVSHLKKNPNWITRQQKRFAWAYAMHGDRKKAIKDAGFGFTNIRSIDTYSNQLLTRPIVQRAVSEAFRQQIQLAHEDENKFVIRRMIKTQDRLDEILDTLTEKIKDGEVSKEEVEVLNSVLKTSKELMASNAELLGYKGESESFEMQIKGKRRTFDYAIPPATDVKFKEIDEKETEHSEQS